MLGVFSAEHARICVVWVFAQVISWQGRIQAIMTRSQLVVSFQFQGVSKFNSPEPAYQRRGGRWKSKNISKQLQAIQTVAPPEPRDDKNLCFCFWSKKHENCVFDQRNTKSCWKGTSRSLPWTSAITVSTWYLSVIMWNHNSWQVFLWFFSSCDNMKLLWYLHIDR